MPFYKRKRGGLGHCYAFLWRTRSRVFREFFYQEIPTYSGILRNIYNYSVKRTTVSGGSRDQIAGEQRFYNSQIVDSPRTRSLLSGISLEKFHDSWEIPVECRSICWNFPRIGPLRLSRVKSFGSIFHLFVLSSRNSYKSQTDPNPRIQVHR